MFEQALIQEDLQDKKRYTVLVSLLLQVTTLGVLIVVPLIYTQVLPQAKLRSVFAAPTPPPPALPKAPDTTVRTTAQTQQAFRPSSLPDPVAIPVIRHSAVSLGDAAPDIQGPAGVDSSLIGASSDLIQQMRPPDPPPVSAPRPAIQRVHLTSMEPSKLINRVQPQYPAMAKQIRVQGKVIFTAVISKQGMIENLELVSGHPLLVKAAREAIQQWRYKPTILNGEPVEVTTNIEVSFILTGQ